MIPITARAVRNASALALIALFAVAIPAVAASGDDAPSTDAPSTDAPTVVAHTPAGACTMPVPPAPIAGEKGLRTVIAPGRATPPTKEQRAEMAAATEALDAFLTAKGIDHSVQKGPDGVKAVLLENPSAADQKVLEEYLRSHEGVPVAIAMSAGDGGPPPPLPALPARPVPSGG